MIGLDSGSDEETGEGDDRQAETAGEVLVCEGLEEALLVMNRRTAGRMLTWE